MSHRKLLAVGLVASLFMASASFAAEKMDDSAIVAKVKSALVGDHETKSREINVEVHDGRVQLLGFVDSAQEKAEATRVANGVEGVRGVSNNLEIREANRTTGEAVDDGMITAKVKAALIGDSRTKAYQIEVNTNGGTVQLGGFVDSATAKSAATEVAGRVKGVRTVHNTLQVK